MAYDDTGLTRVTVLTGLHREVSPEERLRRAVQQTLQGQFDLHGELGRGEDNSVVYLATEHASRRLVALKLVRADASTGDGEDWWVEIVRKLDASVPALESTCMECGGKQRGWGRFCRHCGADLSGVGQGGAQNTSAEDLLREVRSAARGRYDILGQMDRAEGGGIVYFAKEIKSGQLVALRLTRQAPSAGGTEIFQLGVTQVLQDFKHSLGVNQPTTTAGMTRPTLPPPPSTSKESPAYHSAPTPAPTPAPMPAPVATEGPRPADGRLRTIVLVGAVLLLIAAVWFALSRRNNQVAQNTPETPPPILADSGAIRLASRLPAGALMTIDGVPVSGDRIRVAVGSHTIGLTVPGFQDLRQDVEVGKDETLLWSPALVAAAPTPAPTPKISPPPSTRAPRQQQPPPKATTPTDAPPITETPAQKDPPPPANDPRASATSCGGLAAQLEWVRAAPKCEEEARAGGVAAARMLGTMHEQGLGVSRAPATAARWFQQAVEGGDAFAMYRLGYMTMEGVGVRKDERGGMDLLKRAVDASQPDAFYHYGRGLERGRGRPRNMNEAVATFRRGAELNNALSQHKMGLLHMEGDGVARDDRQAADYFTRSANQGYVEAQYLLGEFYRVGRGVPQSDAEARKWLQLAANKGHAGARAALGRIR